MIKNNGDTLAGTTTKKSRFKNNSTNNQQQKVLAALRERGVLGLHRFYAEEVLGICSLAPRILELKAKGFKITKVDISYTDHLGIVHHGVARYVLLAEFGGEL